MHSHGTDPAPTLPHTLRILILDDDPVVGGMLARALQHGACAVELVGNAEDARALLDAGRFHAIVCDYDLSIENSEAFLAHVRDVHPHIRRVLCSGGGAGVAARVLSLGLVHVAVAKPFDLPALRAALDFAGEK